MILFDYFVQNLWRFKNGKTNIMLRGIQAIDLLYITFTYFKNTPWEHANFRLRTNNKLVNKHDWLMSQSKGKTVLMLFDTLAKFTTITNGKKEIRQFGDI
jgi:hypothetical protein